MTLREIFRFEFTYQARRVRTWLYFVVLFVAAYLLTRNSADDARSGVAFVNSPYLVAVTTVICSMLWLLMTAAVAGQAAARDVETRTHPLLYTTPVSKTDYLGGRFLAAFVLNALLLAAVPAAILLGLRVPAMDPEILGPPRPAVHLSAYFLIALPVAFAHTAIQFSLAVLIRRTSASYLAILLLFITSFFVAGMVAEPLEMPTLGKLMDSVGFTTVVGFLEKTWTPLEKNTRLVGLEGSMLASRALWIGIALGLLAFTHVRFRFSHPTETTRQIRAARRQNPRAVAVRRTPITVPQVQRVFGFATHARQTLAFTWQSFRAIAGSRLGIAVAGSAIFGVMWLFAIGHTRVMGVPLSPRTDHVVSYLVAPLANSLNLWVIIPLFIILSAGDLVWRDREAGLSEMVDAAPAPEWASFAGKFLGLGLVLALGMALLTAAGVLSQAIAGYPNFEIGTYLRILFGLQLIDYLLFALLVFLVHAVVNQKHLGYLVSLLVYGAIALPSFLGIEHNLLIYGSDPGWSYSDIRGFGPFLGPWLWFKLYWVAWALLLAVVVRLFWARGSEENLGVRLRLARRRFTRSTAGVAAAAAGLVLALGGFIFYNTNVLNAYSTAADRMEQRAEYERRYGQYEKIPQPSLTGTSLEIDIHPERREAEIQGVYNLVNESAVTIDTIHVATAPNVETGPVDFDRPVAAVIEDDDLDHRIYRLETPLQPGDALRLSFQVTYKPRGFLHRGVDASVIANGTWFTSEDWLPAIGYQSNRVLDDAGQRQTYGLAPRPAAASLEDTGARGRRFHADRITFDAVVSTAPGQVTIAPGVLRRSWTEGGRAYFHYATDAPINNRYGVFSAGYAVREAQWNGVAIHIYHHPAHTATLDRMIAGVRAALDYYTSRFGPYPHSYIRLIENAGRAMGAHAEATTIDYGDEFSLLNPGDGPEDLDLVFAVTAHEVAHQWWGHRLAPAHVEGSPLLAEGLATYSAMRVVGEARGPDQLRRYRSAMRAAFEAPRTRAAVPLLRATDRFLAYRKGPFALYAVSEYIGAERVNDALRRLFEKHESGTPPLPTTLDLYRELQAVTPDSFQYLLHNLFEANTFWELEAEEAAAEPAEGGAWRVTLDVRARKVVVDEAGVETEAPMDDWLQVGVFAPAEPGEELGEPLHLQMHRIRSGKQTITVTTPSMPARAGIDPNNLLIDLETDDNVLDVKIESGR